jgi:uncharacterized protein (TIGR03066 family)
VADDKKDDPKADEKLLVGKWRLVKLSPGELPPGVEIVLDVRKDGKFKIVSTADGQKDENTATWKLDKKKFMMEFIEGSRKGSKQTDTIKELTEKKLVLLDENDVTEEWERVAEKKKDDK